MERWTRRGERTLVENRIFRLKEVRAQHPGRGTDVPFFVLEAGDWVNVIPLTGKGEVVLIRQYRPGTDAVTLEIPGGMVDPGEDPAAAAARELEEETGHRAASLAWIGTVEPNPAIQSNRCHTFLARGCEPAGAMHFDADEHIEVLRTPLGEIPGLIREGRIGHALVVAAFYHLFVTHGIRA